MFPFVYLSGDTLFALGCGRLFEGDARTMWASLSKLLPLPDETRVYCAHEYTQVWGLCGWRCGGVKCGLWRCGSMVVLEVRFCT